jgi:hypothetical protein
VLLFKIKFLTLKFCVWTRCRTVRHSCIYENCQLDIAGQCRTIPWPMVPDWHLLLECRCRMRQLSTGNGRNADVGLTFFWHSGIYIFFSASYWQNNTISSRPSMDVQGVSLFTAISMEVHGVSISTAISIVWMCMVYPFHHQQCGRTWCIPFYCKQNGYAGCVPVRRPRPPPVVWTCRVFLFHPQQYMQGVRRTPSHHQQC